MIREKWSWYDEGQSRRSSHVQETSSVVFLKKRDFFHVETLVGFKMTRSQTSGDIRTLKTTWRSLKKTNVMVRWSDHSTLISSPWASELVVWNKNRMKQETQVCLCQQRLFRRSRYWCGFCERRSSSTEFDHNLQIWRLFLFLLNSRCSSVSSETSCAVWRLQLLCEQVRWFAFCFFASNFIQMFRMKSSRWGIWASSLQLTVNAAGHSTLNVQVFFCFFPKINWCLKFKTNKFQL